MGICIHNQDSRRNHSLMKYYEGVEISEFEENLLIAEIPIISQRENVSICEKYSKLCYFYYLPIKIRAEAKECSLFGIKANGNGNQDKKISLIYEKCVHSLSEQIENRKRQNIIKYFSQKELWYLLQKLIKGYQELSQISRIQNYFYYITPEQVLLSSQGQIRILLPELLQDYLNQPIKLIDPHFSQKLQSPQYYLNMSTHKPRTKLEHAFTFGIIMLCAGNLLNYSQLYEIVTGQNLIQSSLINRPLRSKISDQLQKFGKKYSSHLYAVLYELTAQIPENRSSIPSVFHRFQKIYQFKINSNEEFFDRGKPRKQQGSTSHQIIQIFK